MNITRRAICRKGTKTAVSKAKGKDPAYMALVATLPCAICQNYGLTQLSRTQVHHCIHGRYSNLKVPDCMTIPLCEGHHMGDFDTSKIAVHRCPADWKRAYGPDTDYISATQDRVMGMTV